jgi:pimeloyl-ACP methyl ester carboxylesterase
LLPDATLRVVDDAAHLPWLERPGAVVDAIAEHLAQSPLEVVR